MDTAKLAELAVPVFGPDRVTVAARLDDAIGTAAVLVTGSAVTVATRQLPLGPGTQGGRRVKRLYATVLLMETIAIGLAIPAAAAAWLLQAS